MLDIYQAFSRDMQDFSELFTLDADFVAAVAEIPELPTEVMVERLKAGM